MDNSIYEFSFSDFRILSIHFELKDNEEYKLSKNIEVSTTLSLKHNFLVNDKKLRLLMKIEISGKQLPFFISVEAGGLFSFKNFSFGQNSQYKLRRHHLPLFARSSCRYSEKIWIAAT